MTSPQLASAHQAQATNPWPAVFSVALSASVFCAAEFLPVVLLRFISQALGVSEGIAGLMVTAPAILGAFSAPLITLVIGAHDRRRVLLALAALLVASNVIGVVAPNFGTLIVCRRRLNYVHFMSFAAMAAWVRMINLIFCSEKTVY